MILTLYLALLAVAVIACGLGVVLGEQYFTFVGLFFFFSLGILLLSGSVEYKVGMNSTLCDWRDSYMYGDNYSSYHWDYANPPPPGLSDVNLFHVNRTYRDGCVEIETAVYEDFDKTSAFWYGFLMSLAGGFGMFALLWNARRGFKEWEDERRGERP